MKRRKYSLFEKKVREEKMEHTHLPPNKYQ